jgi:hypothetical protein
MRLASIGLSQLLQRNWRIKIWRGTGHGTNWHKSQVLVPNHDGAEIPELAPDPLCLNGAANHRGVCGRKSQPFLSLPRLAMATLGLMGFVTLAPLSIGAAPIITANPEKSSPSKPPSKPVVNSRRKPAAPPRNRQRQPLRNPTNSSFANSKDKFNPSSRTSGAVRARSLRQLNVEDFLTQNDASNGTSTLPLNGRNGDTTWRVLGQPVMTFDLPPAGAVPSVLNPDTVAPEGSPQDTATPTIPSAPVIRTLTPQQQRQQITERIVSLNQRLAEIIFSLNPEQPWRVDVQPVIIMVTPPEPPEVNPPAPTPTTGQNPPRQTKPAPKPKPKPKPIPVVKSAVIRLQGMPLMEVSAEDVANQNSTSIMDLANSWASALQGLLDSPDNRRRLFAVAGLPETILFQNVPYGLNPQIALDRGLFRTNGERTQGFTVFWEVPPDNNAYKIPPGNYVFEGNNRRIFLLNRLMQFIPYSR